MEDMQWYGSIVALGVVFLAAMAGLVIMLAGILAHKSGTNDDEDES